MSEVNYITVRIPTSILSPLISCIDIALLEDGFSPDVDTKSLDDFRFRLLILREELERGDRR